MTDDLAQVLSDAARLAEQAADALRRGDAKASLKLQKEAENAWWRARRLGQRKAAKPARAKAPTSREQAIAALTELSVPSSPKQIAAYTQARTGQPFDVRTLASIRRDEYRSWMSGSRRDTYLVPSLEGPWFMAGRGRLALSYWPLWQRIVGPLSPRADHLQAADRILERVESPDLKPDARTRMRSLLAEYVRSIPSALEGAWTGGDDLDLGRVRAAVAAELDLIRGQDAESREREADRARRQLTQEQLIWGGAMPQLVERNSGGAA